MNTLKKAALAFTAVFAASTAICGFSIAAQPVVEAISLQFHMGFAAATFLFGALSIALYAKQNKTA
jgi:hypothetical protein